MKTTMRGRSFIPAILISVTFLLPAAIALGDSGLPSQTNARAGELSLEELARQRRAERPQLAFPQRKKLIQNGYDNPTPAELVRKLKTIESAPFDGTVIKLEGHERIFNLKPWNETEFLGDYTNLARLACTMFTDNFIWTDSASDLDWFDDQQWQTVLHNTRLIAKAALLGRCAGIVFDPECYGPHTWEYQAQPQRAKHTFAEFQARAKQCGEEWVHALQEVCPRPRILGLFLTGCDHFVVDFEYATGSDAPLTEESFAGKLKELPRQLPGYQYALVPAFLNGMIKGLEDGGLIIDGNEGAYYYEKQADYEKYRRYAREFLPRAFIDPELRQKYAKVVQVGSSAYVDHCFGDRGKTSDYVQTLSNYLTPGEQARWFEHNIYWGMTTADEYVWSWTEGKDEKKFNWWDGYLPAGCEAALRSAREKVERSQPLGFESESLFRGLWQRLREQRPVIEAQKTGFAPVIDGKLDEPGWTNAAVTGAFLPELDWTPQLKAATTARLVYDEQALYIGFECDAPGSPKKDGSAFEGDHVEVLVAAPGGEFPLCRFGVNVSGKAAGNRVISLANEEWDGTFKPEWQHAIQVGDGVWAAEVAIPWKTLGLKTPVAGTELRINLARQWPPSDERSSWSPVARWFSNFMEPDHFGTVVLK
jgi:hypothetical protein